MKRLLVSIWLVSLIVASCGTQAPLEPSAEIVGEWKSEEFISGGTAGEVDGERYLFLATIQGTAMPYDLMLRVLDVQDPTAPIEVGFLAAPIDTLLPTLSLSLSGTVLYALLGEQEGGLWVVDVSDPASPREITLLSTEDDMALDLALSGNYACIATPPMGHFLIIDISDPVNPHQVGRLELTGEHLKVSGQRIEYAGSLLYVVDRDGLAVIDVSSPSSPQEVGFYANPDWVGEPTEIGSSGLMDLLAPPGSFLDVAASGQHAFIASSNSGLRVLDVSNPASPREVAQLDTSGSAIRVLVSDNLVYLLEVSSSNESIPYAVRIIDISELDNLRIVDSVEEITMMPGYLSLVETGNYIYFLNLDTVLVIDVYASNGNK